MKTLGLLLIAIIAALVVKAQKTNVVAVNNLNINTLKELGGPSVSPNYLSDTAIKVEKRSAQIQYESIQPNSAFFARTTKIVWVQPSIMRSNVDGITSTPTGKIINLPMLSYNVILVDNTVLQDASHSSITITYQ